MALRNLRSALRIASLPAGIAAALASPLAAAQDAAPEVAQAPESQAATLDRIEVTGSRIRRVDAENASPVITIDRAAIEKTGKITIGDLVQELPTIAGAATNPTVNNGGGSGASTVDLRGLGSQRTLVLINGRRVLRVGGLDGGADVNAIPASAVERIEVLTVGASSVYGSDAIGGVVNFIMRKDFEGLQASVDYGISSRQDGQRTGGSLTFGQAAERGNIIAGVSYNKFDAISSNDRDYSKDATYLYGGYVTVLGSSRNPRGFISLPEDNPTAIALGCANVTRVPGAVGDDPVNDYRCYDPSVDSYNYQAVNLIQTPQERSNAFFLGNYQISDDLNAFIEYYHNKTAANFAIAALPFDARTDAVVISADNFYNPFGVDFGADANITGQTFRNRFTSLGQRAGFFDTTTDQLVTGIEGFLGDSWKWDVALNYGHRAQDTQVKGYVFYDGLRDALGPSFMDTDGIVKCGSPGNVIAGCVPLNIFNIDDPQTIETLRLYNVNPVASTTYISKGLEANASGDLFELPAGVAQLAFGAQWRKEYQRSEVEYVSIANPDATCMISQEACGSPVKGGFTASELYAELFLPLLKDVPFAKTLNVTLGSRFSDYDLFGSNTSSKIQVEWRPMDDLLFRGTVAEVFRAPSITDLYAGPAGNAPVLQDRCVGYVFDPANPSIHDRACGPASGATNIPAGGIEDSGLSQSTGVISGAAYVGYDLKPEQGKSFDWGLVYDPSWLPGFSVSLDYWRLYLNDTITNIDAQIVLNSCYDDPNNQLCDFVNRFSDGQINYIRQPTVNLGRLDAKGWDLALRYRLNDTASGDWTFGFDGTYTAQWDNDTDPDSELDPVRHIAGHFNNSYGMFARVRGRAFVNWSMGDWSASWRMRYIGPFDLGNADDRQGSSADAACLHDPVTGAPNEFCGVELHYGSTLYHSLSVSYALPAINSRIDVGVDNVFDKQPPMLFQNNVLNANTDVSTFDTIGRYFFARYTVKF
ncbi:MAG TPA: TonB-dependent receptor [Xanthomonadaceae bacterium]|nr:TonB-dependent receptor [Xanthomonadaceae bacterium]